MATGGLGTAYLTIKAKTGQATDAVRALGKVSAQVAKTTSMASVTSVRAVTAATTAATKSVRALGNNVNQVGRNMRTTGLNAAFAGAALSKAFSGVMGVGAKFERAMDMVGAKAILRETDKEFQMLTKRALQFAEATRFNAVETAKAMEQITVKGIAEVGIDPKTGEALKDFERIASTTRSALDLASIGDIDPDEAASQLGMIVKTFNLGSDAAKSAAENAAEIQDVVDGMSAVSQQASTTIPEIGVALSFAGGQASLLGQPLTQITAAIGVMSDQAIRGSRAGTGLARVFTRLSETDNTSVANGLAKLGLGFKDVDTSTKPLIDILETLEGAGFGATKAMSELEAAGVDVDEIMNHIAKMDVDLSPEETVAVFRTLAKESGIALEEVEDGLFNVASMYELFGQRGGPAALSLIKNLDKLKKLTANIEESQLKNLGEKMAVQVEDNVIGALLRLQSKLASVAITLFDTVREPVRDFVEYLSNKVDELLTFFKGNADIGQLVTFIFAGLTAGISALGVTVLILSGLFLALGGIIESIGLAVSAVSLPLVAALTAGFVALSAATYKVFARFNEFRAAVARFKLVDRIVDTFWSLVDVIKAIGEASANIADAVINTFLGLFDKINSGDFGPFQNSVDKLNMAFKEWGATLRRVGKRAAQFVEEFSGVVWKGLILIINTISVEVAGLGEVIRSALNEFSATPGEDLKAFVSPLKSVIRGFFLLAAALIKVGATFASLKITFWFAFFQGIVETVKELTKAARRAGETSKFFQGFRSLGESFKELIAAMSKLLGGTEELRQEMTGSSWVERAANGFKILGRVLGVLLLFFIKIQVAVNKFLTVFLEFAGKSSEKIEKTFTQLLANIIAVFDTGDPFKEFKRQLTVLKEFIEDEIVDSILNIISDLVDRAIEAGKQLIGLGKKKHNASSIALGSGASAMALWGTGSGKGSKGAEEPSSADEAMEEMANNANKPGSIYTHDTHLEKILKKGWPLAITTSDSGPAPPAPLPEKPSIDTPLTEFEVAVEKLMGILGKGGLIAKELRGSEGKIAQAIKAAANFPQLKEIIIQSVNKLSKQLAGDSSAEGVKDAVEDFTNKLVESSARYERDDFTPALRPDDYGGEFIKATAKWLEVFLKGAPEEKGAIEGAGLTGPRGKSMKAAFMVLFNHVKDASPELKQRLAKILDTFYETFKAATPDKFRGILEQLYEKVTKEVAKATLPGRSPGPPSLPRSPGPPAPPKGMVDKLKKAEEVVKDKVGKVTSRVAHGVKVMEDMIARRGGLSPAAKRNRKIAEMRRKVAEKKAGEERERSAIFSEGSETTLPGMIAHPLGQREYGTIKARMGTPEIGKQHELSTAIDPKVQTFAPDLTDVWHSVDTIISEQALKKIKKVLQQAKSSAMGITGTVASIDEVNKMWEEFIKTNYIQKAKQAFLLDKTGGSIIPLEEVDAMWEEYKRSKFPELDIPFSGMIENLPSALPVSSTESEGLSENTRSVEVTDNRNLTMDINTTVDAAEMARQLENLFFNSNIGAVL